MIIFLNRVFVKEIKGFNIFLMICSEQEGTLFFMYDFRINAVSL